MTRATSSSDPPVDKPSAVIDALAGGESCNRR